MKRSLPPTVANAADRITPLCGAVALLLTLGCPSSDNPLPSQGDINEITSPFLGDWLLTGFLGKTSGIGYMTLNLSMQGSNALIVSTSDGSKTVDYPCTLNEYSSTVYASILSESELDLSYGITTIVLIEPDPDFMEVFPLDSVALEESIAEETIAGEVTDGGNFGKMITITDSSANLESYMTSSPNVFEDSPIMVFTRQE